MTRIHKASGAEFSWVEDDLYWSGKPTGASIIPDDTGLWRVKYQGKVSDIVNRIRAKEAAIYLVREWHRRQEAAGAPPMRQNGEGVC